LTKRVLVIDDEPQMLLGLRDNLELEGYESSPHQRRGRPAAALAAKPDLVILDLMLRGGAGSTCAASCARAAPAVPIIMLTARSQEADKVLGLELGADDYITKPFASPSSWRGCGPSCAGRDGAGGPESCRLGDVEVNFRTHRPSVAASACC